MTASPQKQFDADIYNAAMEMLDRGWSIIPMSPVTKQPLVTWKIYQTRQPTYDEVESWFNTWTGFNLAVITGHLSGIVVVDADTPEAVQWCEKNGMTSPFAVKTRRGTHYYFRHPRNGQRFRNVAHNITRGGGLMGVANLDFRGDGGYVVVPPSISRSEEKGDHPYTWGPMLLDWDDMPVWSGRASLQDVTEIAPEDFAFDMVDLSGVKLRDPKDALPIWERTERWVQENGRKLREGDGRNALIVSYAGERVRAGVLDDDLDFTCRQFQDAFFEEHLPEEEFATCLRSAQEMDLRNHPSDYDAAGNRIKKPEPPAEPAPVTPGALRPVYPSDVEIIEAALQQRTYLIAPWMRRGSITMVHGYSGSGKSWFLTNVLWHLALGRTVGPYEIERPARTLYLDFENSGSTIAARMRVMAKSYGDPGQHFAVWSPALIRPEAGGDMNLATKEGMQRLQAWIGSVQPDVVVIDTVRSAWPGMEENKAEAWAPVNQLLLTLRNAGLSVVVVHHSTKPGEHGVRESGSSNQLSQLENQLKVSQVYQDEERARDRGGRCDVAAIDALNRLLKSPDDRLLAAFHIDYGKTREWTELHCPAFLGIAERDDSTQYVVASSNPRQKAVQMAGFGNTPGQIASALHLPRRTVESWLGDVQARDTRDI